jgi:hypothetical protein
MPDLPDRPDLDQLRRQARELQRAAASGDADALHQVRSVAGTISLSAAQLAIARDHGFASWPHLKAEVEDALRQGRRLVARVRLTDFRGNPICARLRPPDIEWSVRPGPDLGSGRDPDLGSGWDPDCGPAGTDETGGEFRD